MEGRISSMPARKEDIVANFFSKVNMPSLFDCWVWTGGLKPGGYGVFCVKRYPLYAHRWSYEYHNGSIPEGMVIDHICRNKRCVNPAHLRAVTQRDNLNWHYASLTHCAKGHTLKGGDNKRCKECEDIRVKRSRKSIVPLPKKQLSTHCARGHAFTEDNIYKNGKSRTCKTCHTERDRIRREKNKQGIQVSRLKTHCKRGHAFTEENTILVKRGRKCRACANIFAEKIKERRTRYPIKPIRYTKREWEDLKEKYHNKCLRCERDDVKLTADHVVPLKEGGAETIDNIQPLCMPCNIWKRAKFIDFRPLNS
jgi:hypothetical protein